MFDLFQHIHLSLLLFLCNSLLNNLGVQFFHIMFVVSRCYCCCWWSFVRYSLFFVISLLCLVVLLLRFLLFISCVQTYAHCDYCWLVSWGFITVCVSIYWVKCYLLLLIIYFFLNFFILFLCLPYFVYILFSLFCFTSAYSHDLINWFHLIRDYQLFNCLFLFGLFQFFVVKK